MELTPRTLDEPGSEADVDTQDGAGLETDETEGTSPSRSRRRWLAVGVLVLVLVALGVIVVQGLSDATLYFRNADEAVAQQETLGDERFRLQGTVTGEPQETEDGVVFDVTYNDVDVTVHHEGEPQQMFRPGIPVVLEGAWHESGEYFASDTMLVRHDADYQSEDEYDERMDEADEEPGDR